MTEPAASATRRLGVYSLGFLWQPKLRRALADAGWRIQPGQVGADAIGVWGRRGVAWRGLAAARRTGKPVLTIEDGFLRSVDPGGQPPIISLILDDIGVYYDHTLPSRLERLITEGCGDVVRARAGIDRLRNMRLSKYNDAPAMPDPPRDHILVVDQTRGDASITWGGADEGSFDRMFAAAKADHPGAEIVVKRHPDVIAGRKRGHLDHIAPNEATIVADPTNPWDLIDNAKAVYTVSSQLGFEALVAGRQVRCFGAPFYSGWGATEDEVDTPRREVKRSAEEIFAAAYLDYPTYFDPWRGGLGAFEDACAALEIWKSARDANRLPSVCSGVRLWKRKYMSGFLMGPGGAPRFYSHSAQAERAAIAKKARHIAWGSTPAGDGVVRVEDGFLRSAGLGAELTPPLSLSFDDLGVYYDPTRPSRLEDLIAKAPETEAARSRAAALISQLTQLGVTKYNTGGPAPLRPDHPRVILAPGQVEDDASILKGAKAVRTNLELLKTIREQAPDAFVIYKPHPDVEAGLRPGAISPDSLRGLADDVLSDVSAHAALAISDEVWTITSLMGFEALIRGKAVTTLGAPFYAGWGLTRDLGNPPERRTACPSLEAFVHAVLIDYPAYRDPVSGLLCPPEVIVDRLVVGLGQAGLGGRLLSKAQGLAASYAWIWR